MRVIKVSNYRDKCIGCGVCENLAPHNWEMDSSDGKASLIGSVDKKVCFTGEIMEVDLAVNLQIQEECPVKCIKIHN